MISSRENELIEAAIAFTRREMAMSAGHDWMHIERVMGNAERIGEAEGADLLAVRLGAVMHDIVNLPKDHPEREAASTLSAEKAATWLEGRLEAERIATVYEAIRCHSFSAGFVPRGLVAKVLSDADKLDALGAIGIARTFEIGGLMGTATLAEFDPFCEVREPEDKLYTVDHFYRKLLKLEERFYTESGQAAARRRIGFMREFLSELRAEVEGALEF